MYIIKWLGNHLFPLDFYYTGDDDIPWDEDIKRACRYGSEDFAIRELFRYLNSQDWWMESKRPNEHFTIIFLSDVNVDLLFPRFISLTDGG